MPRTPKNPFAIEIKLIRDIVETIRKDGMPMEAHSEYQMALQIYRTIKDEANTGVIESKMMAITNRLGNISHHLGEAWEKGWG